MAEGTKRTDPAVVSDDEDDDGYFLDQVFSGLYDNNTWDCIECYLNLQELDRPDQNPLNYAHICEQRQQDDKLLALQVKYPDNHVYMDLDDNVDDIICYGKDPTKDDWKIALPESMLVDTVKWFHQVMGHPSNRMLCDSLSQCHHHPKLCYHVDRLKCKDCQKHKFVGRGYGLVPEEKCGLHPGKKLL
jgi:hypothetical protein